MPVGAFGARDEIMDKLSPDGPVYQAGTLSGNPVAMNAGLTSIKKLKNDPEIYKNMQLKALKLMTGFKEAAKQNGISLQTRVRGSMFGFFFNENPVKNFDDALNCDTDLFAKFHSKMLEEGIYLACSQFETGFISAVMSDDMIDEVIEKSKKVFRALK